MEQYFQSSESLRHCSPLRSTADRTADHGLVCGRDGGAESDKEKVCEFYVKKICFLPVSLLHSYPNRHRLL
jgi:hypothetical protein